jgi:hypothetical protein
MQSIIKYILYAIASVALFTGLNVLIGGAPAIPGATAAVEASVDNELRFFSVFWLAYGAFCFWVARDVEARQPFIPYIAVCFFLGGVARLSSFLWVGSPGSALLAAMVLEFILPMAIYFCLLSVNKSKQTSL